MGEVTTGANPGDTAVYRKCVRPADTDTLRPTFFDDHTESTLNSRH